MANVNLSKMTAPPLRDYNCRDEDQGKSGLISIGPFDLAVFDLDSHNMVMEGTR